MGGPPTIADQELASPTSKSSWKIPGSKLIDSAGVANVAQTTAVTKTPLIRLVDLTTFPLLPVSVFVMYVRSDNMGSIFKGVNQA